MTGFPPWLWRELALAALILARLAPVTFLCPVLGGSVAPPTVRLGVALALTAFIARHQRPAAGLDLDSATSVIAALAAEGVFGLGLGLASAAPFDAARVGGRLIDLARGSSAEAALPVAGTKEAASGDLLYQLLVALAALGTVVPAIVGALCRSFAAVPIGTALSMPVEWEQAIAVSGSVLATGLAIAAPVIVACLTVELTLGLATRLGSAFHLQDQLPGLRLIVGAITFWVGLGATANAMLAAAGASL